MRFFANFWLFKAKPAMADAPHFRRVHVFQAFFKHVAHILHAFYTEKSENEPFGPAGPTRIRAMYQNKKIIAVMPAYNAEKTLRKTHGEILDQKIVDKIIVVDDASRDQTVAVAKNLENTLVHTHDKNKGYGANQKSCYRLALEAGGDIVIMVHPDYQYTPRLIPAMVSMIASGLYHCVLGSRILGGHALKGGMPAWKYTANRFLTFSENLFLGAKLSEYHTGYRAFSAELLRHIPMEKNSDDFVFDNQMLAQIIWCGYTVAEVSCPTRYFPEASSINFKRSVVYGLGCLATSFQFRLADTGWLRVRRFPPRLRHSVPRDESR